MTQTITEQAFQLMDNINILIDEAQHLDEKTLSKLQKMEVKMNIFIAEFHKHSALTAQEYTSYLNHDAQSQLTFILGYSELFRSVAGHTLSILAQTSLNYICLATRQLSETLRQERDMMLAQRDKLTNS